MSTNTRLGAFDSADGSAVEWRRVGVFLAVAFGSSLAAGVAIYATGGLTDSPRVAGLPVSLADILLTATMFSPALGNVVARAVTGEGRERLLLRPRVREQWRSYLLAWFAPPALVGVGVAVYLAVFPGRFALAAGPRGLLLAVAGSVTYATLFNTVFAFGEEFGWRGYLLPKLLPLGVREALVVHGVVWGMWHWPAIAMGYNYGFGYPGAPWTGMAAMALATVGLGTFLAWVTVRSGSVWPASVGHGAINATGGFGLLVTAGETSSLFGPGVVGLLPALPWLLLAAWLAGRLAPDRPGAGSRTAGA